MVSCLSLYFSHLSLNPLNCSLQFRYLDFLFSSIVQGGGGGSKALTMTMTPWNLPHGQWSKKLTMTMKPSISPMVSGQGGGGKAPTMTMTPWNLTHGQWSKKLTMATDILESAPWSIVKMVILRSNFVVRSTVYHFDHRKFVFRPWPWSKLVFFG